MRERRRTGTCVVKPLYRKIHDDLVALIASGALRPGDKVSSENELASRYGASRLTVQRALQEMAARGLVRRARGSGTFVSDGPGQFSLIEIRDPEEEIRSRGGVPSRHLRAQEACDADRQLAAIFAVGRGERIFHSRVVEADRGVPVALVDRWAMPDMFPDFLEQDFVRTSVFSYWANRTSLDEVQIKVDAVALDADTAGLLRISVGEPCLRLSRTNQVQGRVVTYARIVFAGARMELASRYRPSDLPRP